LTRKRLSGPIAAGALALAVAIALAGTSSAAPAAPGLAVYFLQGEQLKRVNRPGATPTDALRRLIAGPTSAEAKLGMRTYVPARTPVRRVTVQDGLATVDLGKRFLARRDARGLLARLSQLVRTMTGVQGTTRVLLLIDGKTVTGVFPGVPTESPVTFRFLQTPNVAVPKPPQPRLGPPDKRVKAVQEQLIELGFLAPGSADGRLGPVTGNGVLAFQKWEGLARTSLIDSRTSARLDTASRPTPVSRGPSSKRAEILLDRQVALLIKDNRVVRTIAVSSGKPSTPTPPGDYRVYAKIKRWWSTPFREWLPLAVPFVGGIAFHEYLDVPAYPASHGCVRQAPPVARRTFDFAEVGMPVKVIARS
jgi:hypothetical protein